MVKYFRFCVLSGAARLQAVLLLVLVLALYLRLHGLGAKPLWQDEIFTVAISSAQNSLTQVASIPLYNTALPAPPLYFLITHFFLLLGDSDFLLRFPALLFGVTGVAATYVVGRRLFSATTGLAGAFLLSVSSLHVRYSQDARFYSLMVLLSLLSLYCLWRALFGEKRLWWAGFVVCSVLNIYNHLFGLLVLLAEAVFVGGFWVASASLGNRSTQGESKGRAGCEGGVGASLSGGFFEFLASMAVIVAAYAPMIPHLLRGLTSGKGLGGEMTPGVSAIPTFLSQVLEAWGNGPGLALVLFLLPFMLGLATCARSRKLQLWLACCWLILPLAALLLVPARHGFRPRYILFMLPVYLILVAEGLVAGGEALVRRIGPQGIEARWVPAAVGMLVLGLVSVPALRSYYDEPRSDWRAVAELLGTTVSEGDMIVSPGPFAQLALTRYNEDLVHAVFSIGGSEMFLSSEQAAQGGVWFVGPGREAMTSTENALRAVTPTLFKVVFAVDADRAEQGIRLSVAPTMYSDLWVLYARSGMELGELIERYEEVLGVVPPAVAHSIRSTLDELYLQQAEVD